MKSCARSHALSPFNGAQVTTRGGNACERSGPTSPSGASFTGLESTWLYSHAAASASYAGGATNTRTSRRTVKRRVALSEHSTGDK
jgi:hypothetical protein